MENSGDVEADCLHSANDVLGLEIIAAGTKHSAQNSRSGAVSQKAFESLLDADRWMIYRNTKTGVVHWDFVSLLLTFIPMTCSAWRWAERPESDDQLSCGR